MSAPCRGQVWDIVFIPEGNNVTTLPFLVLSDDLLNQSPAGIVVVSPISLAPVGICSHVEAQIIDKDNPETIYIRCEEILTVASERCKSYYGSIAPASMLEVDEKIKLILGL